MSSRALAERGQMDAHDVDAIVQVGAELPVGDVGLEIARRRGDDAHVDGARGIVADAAHFALLQRAQQLHLQRHGEVAELVEEQRSLVRLLEQPLPLGGRAGECALGVAEQLTLEQRLGDRRAVHRDERLAPRAGSRRGCAARSAPFPCRSRR